MKVGVNAQPLPRGALLEVYRDMPGAYTDCFSVRVNRKLDVAEFIEAFYTTILFKCERLVLMLIGRGFTDAAVRALARGRTQAFAAWAVEKRTHNQILVCDLVGLTRSWLMVVEAADSEAATHLYFGSAVVARSKVRNGNPQPGGGFRLLQPLHAIYAKALLGAAAKRLSAQSQRHHAP
jgi:hypothetical protein